MDDMNWDEQRRYVCGDPFYDTLRSENADLKAALAAAREETLNVGQEKDILESERDEISSANSRSSGGRWRTAFSSPKNWQQYSVSELAGNARQIARAELAAEKAKG